MLGQDETIGVVGINLSTDFNIFSLRRSGSYLRYRLQLKLVIIGLLSKKYKQHIEYFVKFYSAVIYIC
jgi:hypothetical protein